MRDKGLNKKTSPDNYDTFWDWAEDNRWQVLFSPVYLVFGLVAVLLALLARLVGVTYKEINIFVYYFAIPISWCLIIDKCLLPISIPLTSEADYIAFGVKRWLNIPLLSVLWCALWAFIYYYNRHDFRVWCERAFVNSVKFLLWFKVIGWNYYVSSVIICVLVPILVYCGLIYLCYV